MLQDAKTVFCQGDTAGAISLLEKIGQQYPSDALVMYANKALARLCIIKGQAELAKDKLLYALYYSPSNAPVINLSKECTNLISTDLPDRLRADICVVLSQLYQGRQQYDSAFYYLKLADSDLLPYRDCGNGIEMYRSYLSGLFADHYLSTGDTTSAINRLLDYMLNPNGNTKQLIAKLKPLLLQKWTQQEINRQIDYAIRNPVYTEIADNEYNIAFTLFGHTISEHWYSKTRDTRKIYSENKGFQLLRNSK